MLILLEMMEIKLIFNVKNINMKTNQIRLGCKLDNSAWSIFMLYNEKFITIQNISGKVQEDLNRVNALGGRLRIKN